MTLGHGVAGVADQPEVRTLDSPTIHLGNWQAAHVSIAVLAGAPARLWPIRWPARASLFGCEARGIRLRAQDVLLGLSQEFFEWLPIVAFPPCQQMVGLPLRKTPVVKNEPGA